MRILFTKSELPLSKAIRGVTGEPVSHVALDFGWIVVHSNLLGVHIEWASKFKKDATVVYTLKSTATYSLLEDMLKLDKLLVKYEWAWYDFGGLLFDGLAISLKHWFKIPLPKRNLWESSGMFLCTGWVTEYVEGEKDSMITPYQLYLKLKATNEWGDSNGQESDTIKKD